jgi:flagellar hook assembly protein FlgD
VYSITININKFSPLVSVVEIYSFNGRRVCSLPLSGRARSVIWDGRDGNGKNLESGLYYVKYGQSIERIVLLKQ